MSHITSADLETQSSCRSDQLRTLAESFDHILQLVNTEPAETVLDAVTQIASTCSGCQSASITLLTRSRFRTASATDDRARQIDQLQYDQRSGPCLDAARRCTVVHIEDTLTDDQWPIFAREAAQKWGVGSVLSYRLTLEECDETVASLNLYALQRAAFDEERIGVAGLVAVVGALAVTAARSRENAATLARGLETNREIGMAIGVLMYAHKLARDQAFDLLRIASQHQNRKLRDVAATVVETGTITVP
jgi:GAF domain-containing protein